MSIPLRDYQQDAVAAVMSAFDRGIRRPALSAPTGSGKTVMIGHVVREVDQRALVIAHRREIVEKNAATISAVLDGQPVGIVMEHQNQARAPIISASVQTIANVDRLRKMGDFGLVVCDEAHHAVSPSWITLLDRLGAGEIGTTRLLGVSATWDRLDNVGLQYAFDEIVYQIRMEQLIAEGHLSDILPLRIHVDIDLKDVKRNRSGDYQESSLADAIAKRPSYAKAIAQAMAEHARNRCSLVFAPDIRAANEYAERINEYGMSARVVTGSTDHDVRAQTILDLREHRIDAIVNCGVFTEGTDIPEVDCIVMGRPTKSRALYQQMLGRGMRTSINKVDCLVLDMVGTVDRLEIQTIADLFGIPPQSASVKQAVAEKDATLSIPVETEDLAYTGATATHLRGFDRSKLKYVQIDAGTFSLSVGDDNYLIAPKSKGMEAFTVIRADRNGKYVETISDGLDIGYSQGILEDRVRTSESAHLAQKNAHWRKRMETEPATEKQLKYLRWKRIPYPPQCSKAKASELIEADKARAAQRSWMAAQ